MFLCINRKHTGFFQGGVEMTNKVHTGRKGQRKTKKMTVKKENEREWKGQIEWKRGGVSLEKEN